MTNSTTRTRLLASSMISGFTLAAVSATGAYAQTAPAAAPAATSASTVQELVVTGSRIPQPNLTSISPVAAISSNTLKLEGAQRVEDLLNQLPEVIGEQGGNLSNGSTGTATISLRGLGSKRTAVLIDGRRLLPGDPTVPSPDVNFIPAALIDRVEVETGGASAVYGADAVAGVVNFIMKKDFEGVRLDVNGGIFQHTNNNTASQAVNAAHGFTAPNDSPWDGKVVDVTAIIGANSPDGKGGVEAYVEYRHIDPILQAARDYSFCNEKVSGGKFVCAGSALSANGNFYIYDANFNLVHHSTLDTATPGNFRPFAASDQFNFAPFNYYQRPDERYSGGFFAHYDITRHIQAYSQFMFMDDHTVSQIAPTPFGKTVNIPCNNPLLSAQEVMQICTDTGFAVSNPNVFLGKRNVEGGPRQDDLRHTDYRTVVGLKGDLNDNWHFDVYGQYAASVYSDNHLNDISNSRALKALDAVPNPAVGGVAGVPVGAAVCQSKLDGTDPNCVPWNLFTPGGVTPAQQAYLTVPGLRDGNTTEQVVSGAITGDTGPYGVKSPWAHDGVGVALGAEYRRETLDFEPDLENQLGDIAGNGSKTPPSKGAYDVKEVFGEVRIPIIQDMPLAKDVELEGGYRFSHYSSTGDSSTYKLGANWQVSEDLRLRGGYNRAVRAPNILELFTPQDVALDGANDFCAGPNPAAVDPRFTPAACANSGVSAAQYGKIAPNPAAQYNGLLGGNPNLQPEVASTYTVGAVLTPHSIVPGMSLSADYFNITTTGVIQGIGADSILLNCIVTGAPSLCDLVHRAPGTGSLWQSFSGFIVDTVQNLGSLKTSGVDFTFDYGRHFTDFGMPDYGSLAISFLGTYTHNYTIQGAPGTPARECVGLFGTFCQGTSTPLGGPIAHFKSTTRLTWTSPWNLGLSVNWRFIGPANLDTGNTTLPDSHIGAFNYFDLAATYRFHDRYQFRIGVNNIFDRDPPIIGQGELPGTVGSGNTFPEVYDSMGRYIFAGLTADF